jgi:hypothetical protein
MEPREAEPNIPLSKRTVAYKDVHLNEARSIRHYGSAETGPSRAQIKTVEHQVRLRFAYVPHQSGT